MTNQFDDLFHKVEKMFRATEFYEDQNDHKETCQTGDLSDKENKNDTLYTLLNYQDAWQEVMSFIIDNKNNIVPQCQRYLTLMYYACMGLKSRRDENELSYNLSLDDFISYHEALYAVIKSHDAKNGKHVNSNEYSHLCVFEPTSEKLLLEYPESFNPVEMQDMLHDNMNPYYRNKMRQSPLHISKSGNMMIWLTGSYDHPKEEKPDIFMAHRRRKGVYFTTDKFYGSGREVLDNMVKDIISMLNNANSISDVEIFEKEAAEFEEFIEMAKVFLEVNGHHRSEMVKTLRPLGIRMPS